MTKKGAADSDESVTSGWNYFLPTYSNQEVPVIYLYSDDEVEILPTPPKRKYIGSPQAPAETSSTKKSPIDKKRLTTKTIDEMESKKDVLTNVKLETAGCSMVRTLECINVPTMVTGGTQEFSAKPTDIQSSQSSCSPV